MQRRSEWVGELHKNRLLSGHDPNAGLTYFFTSLCLSVSPCESWLANFENGMKVTGAKRQVKPGDRTCCKIKRREDEELHFESCQSGPQTGIRLLVTRVSIHRDSRADTPAAPSKGKRRGEGDSPMKRRTARACIVAAFGRSRSETELASHGRPYLFSHFPMGSPAPPLLLPPVSPGHRRPQRPTPAPARNLPLGPRSHSGGRSRPQ